MRRWEFGVCRRRCFEGSGPGSAVVRAVPVVPGLCYFGALVANTRDRGVGRDRSAGRFRLVTFGGDAGALVVRCATCFAAS